MQSTKKLPGPDRYEAETRITQKIIDAGVSYDNFILSWEAYVVRQKPHIAACVNSKEQSRIDES